MGKNFSLNHNRAWMNWKKAFVHFTLLNSKVPSQETIEQYEASLKEAAIDQQSLSCDQFLKVSLYSHFIIIFTICRFQHGSTNLKEGQAPLS